VKIFVMGANTWREEDDWPLPDTQFRPYYLHGAGRANTATGNGTLSTEAPGDESGDAYLYDRRNPVPTNGGATLIPGAFIATNAGPRDQRGIETRDDVLCYTAEPLERPTEVTGPIELVLFASSSARDTDFTAKLVDVYPSSRAESITDGILRARFRESLAKPVLMEPNQVYELHITVGATSQVFEAGASYPSGGLQQQLPALRSQHQHRRSDSDGNGKGLRAGGQPRLSRQYAPLISGPTHH